MRDHAQWLVVICASLFLLGNIWAQTNPAASENTLNAEAVLKSDAPVAIAYMISVVILKITAFVLGYLIVRLGHDTLIKGVTGAFDFGFEGGGVSTKLKAATPGTFFVLAGAAIIIWGLFVSKPYQMEFSVKPAPAKQSAVKASPDTSHMMPVLPE